MKIADNRKTFFRKFCNIANVIKHKLEILDWLIILWKLNKKTGFAGCRKVFQQLGDISDVLWSAVIKSWCVEPMLSKNEYKRKCLSYLTSAFLPFSAIELQIDSMIMLSFCGDLVLKSHTNSSMNFSYKEDKKKRFFFYRGGWLKYNISVKIYKIRLYYWLILWIWDGFETTFWKRYLCL